MRHFSRMERIARVTICIFWAIFFLAGCGRGVENGEYSRTEPIMHTFVQVKISAPGRTSQEMETAVDKAMLLARDLEKKLSTFDPDSEVNNLNVKKLLDVSPELFSLLRDAKRMSRITDGAFDITVSPLLKADGFYSEMPEDLRAKIPDETKGVGWRNVTFRLDGKSVLLRKGAWIDLSGIAKGYIVDQMVALLREDGFKGVMVNAGGDVYCGDRGEGLPWKVGLRKPGSSGVTLVIDARDVAVATSGDYENVVLDRDTGREIAHIIDPATDRALVEVPSSITVIAPDCVTADALATGMMAMGTDKAIALADSLEDVEIVAVECPDGVETISTSKGANKYISGERR